MVLLSSQEELVGRQLSICAWVALGHLGKEHFVVMIVTMALATFPVKRRIC